MITVVGRVLPFGDLSDPTAANMLDESMVSAGDSEVAADLAEARAAGLLAATPEEAWGNAAIEGSGSASRSERRSSIPRPTRRPRRIRRSRPGPATPSTSRPEALVLAGSPDAPLLVSLGAPAAIAARHRGPIVLGLVGGVIAIVSAMTLAVLIGGPS